MESEDEFGNAPRLHHVTEQMQMVQTITWPKAEVGPFVGPFILVGRDTPTFLHFFIELGERKFLRIKLIHFQRRTGYYDCFLTLVYSRIWLY